MIRSFRHKGLKRLYLRDEVGGLPPELVERIRELVAHLDVAVSPRNLDLPGYRLHPLKGNLKGIWSLTVSGNWRMTFRMEDGDVLDLDLVDYH